MIARENIQRLLQAAGYYSGPLNGDFDQATLDAAMKIVRNHEKELDPSRARWDATRYVVAGAQFVLKYAGFNPGVIDGLNGHNTEEAYNDWVSVKDTGQPRNIPQIPVTQPPGVKSVTSSFPSQTQCVAFYGLPGLPGTAAEAAMAARLTKISLPFAFRIDYSLNQKVTTMRLHQKCAASAEAAYKDVFKTYGQDNMVKLGLDRFGGSYMPRYMRGSTKTFSMHAYGCAIDTYAAPNGLNTHKPNALFSKPEYKDWFDIWAEHGWTSLGRVIDRDYMHVQAAHL